MALLALEKGIAESNPHKKSHISPQKYYILKSWLN